MALREASRRACATAPPVVDALNPYYHHVCARVLLLSDRLTSAHPANSHRSSTTLKTTATGYTSMCAPSYLIGDAETFGGPRPILLLFAMTRNDRVRASSRHRPCNRVGGWTGSVSLITPMIDLLEFIIIPSHRHSCYGCSFQFSSISNLDHSLWIHGSADWYSFIPIAKNDSKYVWIRTNENLSAE